MALGIGFLGWVLHLGLQARAGDGLRPPLQARLGALAASLQPDTPLPILQQRLEDALAASPELQAIDWVDRGGTVRASTEPSARGRPAGEGLHAAGLRAPLGERGELVAYLVEAPDGTRAAGVSPWLVLALAVGLPLLAVAAQLQWPPAQPPGAAQAAAHRRLRATRDRLARAVQELEWLEAHAPLQETGIWTRTGERTLPPPPAARREGAA